MRTIQGILIGVAVAALASCNRADAPVSPLHPDESAHAAAAGIPLEAHVQFGIDEHGSPFPPPDEHDGSGHARDHIYPREVVIAAGGTDRVRHRSGAPGGGVPAGHGAERHSH
jgi:hypothetical protein